ncbi:hypothetical protein V8G54_005323 [Vigna mungo]|uniref:Uncharacterized protein n=1 Tax=Vigna mungo TaxID=3915 RepID=A0AAQ3S6Y2_VIGMU
MCLNELNSNAIGIYGTALHYNKRKKKTFSFIQPMPSTENIVSKKKPTLKNVPAPLFHTMLSKKITFQLTKKTKKSKCSSSFKLNHRTKAFEKKREYHFNQE